MASLSLLHQLLVDLAEKQLEVLLPSELAAMARARALAWTPSKGDLGAVAPAELRADLVMRLGTEDAAEHVVIVEVQLRWEEEKRWRWPHYFAAARDRCRCNVSLVVVTPTRQVASRCASGTEFLPGTNWRPLVLGPDDALTLLQRDPRAAYSPEARMLLVLLAGRRGGAEMAHHALDVIQSLDSSAHPHYLEGLDRMLSPAGRTLLRSLTMNQLAADNVWKHKNPLTRALLREGQETELLRLVAPHCSEDELAALKALPDLENLRVAVRERLGPMQHAVADEAGDRSASLTRALLREGQHDGARTELLALAAPHCSDDEFAVLKEMPDLHALRTAVYARLGLPAPATSQKK